MMINMYSNNIYINRNRLFNKFSYTKCNIWKKWEIL